jgi:hypothetical protein
MWQLIKQEPDQIQGVIQAGLALAIAFGTDLTSGQVAAILAFAAALLSFLSRGLRNP